MVLPISAIGGGITSAPIGQSTPSASGGSGGSFGKMLSNSIDAIDSAQAQANAQTQAVATGQSTNLSSAVMSVEEASLEVSLAAQVQTKAVDAYQSIFQTTV